MTDSSSSDHFSPTNQTQFENEAWLYDANKPEPAAASVSAQPKVAFFQTIQGKIIGIAGIFVFCLVALVVVVVLNRRQSAKPTVVENVTPNTTIDLGPLGDKVKALSVQLKAADPTKELDPFPPLNLTARLDPVESY